MKIIDQADQNSGSVIMDTHLTDQNLGIQQSQATVAFSVSFSLHCDSVHLFVLWIITSIFMHKYTVHRYTEDIWRTLSTFLYLRVQYVQVVYVYILYVFLC